MRTSILTQINSTVAGVRNRQVVLGTVEVRSDRSLRMRDFYQHAAQAMARLLTALERHFKPATALALATAPASSRTQMSSGSLSRPAPRCWQRKPAGQHPSAIRS